MRLAILSILVCVHTQAQYREASVCQAQATARDGDQLTIRSHVNGELHHGHWWLAASQPCGTAAEPTIPLVGQDHGNVTGQQWVQLSDAQAFLLFRKLKTRREIQGVTFLVRGTIKRNPYWWLALKAYQLGLFPHADATQVAPVVLVIDSAEIIA